MLELKYGRRFKSGGMRERVTYGDLLDGSDRWLRRGQEYL